MKHAVVSFPKKRIRDVKIREVKIRENAFCPFGAQNPLPVKRNCTQISLIRTSNHKDLAAFEEHR